MTTVRVLGDNKLPNLFSSGDVEVLDRCVCGSGMTSRIYEEFGLGVEKCANCGIVRSNPRLKQEAIQRCYEAGAKNPAVFSEIYDRKPVPTIGWRNVANRYRDIARKLATLFPKGTSPLLIEVGFGRGEFLPHLREAGFNVQGFDVAETACANLEERGIPATCAPSLQEARFPENSLDILVMWEVFEHIPEPDEFAAEVYRILKPGGYWFLQVPNWRWLDLKTRVVTKLPGKKTYISKYGLIAPVFHLYHYTHESLKRLLGSKGFVHHKSMRIRLYDETNYRALAAHEAFFVLDAIPALITRNRIHRNVVLCEVYRKPG